MPCFPLLNGLPFSTMSDEGVRAVPRAESPERLGEKAEQCGLTGQYYSGRRKSNFASIHVVGTQSQTKSFRHRSRKNSEKWGSTIGEYLHRWDDVPYAKFGYTLRREIRTDRL